MNDASDPDLVAIRNNDPRFEHARRIRSEVFVKEQGCPVDEEWDDMDDRSTHLLLYVDGVPAGTLRYFEDDGWMHIGRLAVQGAYRGLGLAKRLFARALDDGRAGGFTRVFLNAQYDKTDFYRRFGFTEVGDEFIEAGIRHRRMEKSFIPSAQKL